MTVTVPARRRGARPSRIPRRLVAAFALLAYVPLLLTARGQVAADTKAYLYLDPGRLLSRAGFLWDPNVDAGTVTHQNIGYLFPMGPYYWLAERLGVPIWVAQRFWLGSLLLGAGLGTMWMLRRLGLRGPGVGVAGLVYMLSPYVLSYFGRTSALLLPWAALPWLVGLVALAIREQTWRAPALVAVVVTLMAGTNASSVVFVLLGPALLVPHLVWVSRDADWADAWRALLRIAVVTVPAQLWWVAGLRVQGAYGLPILQLTETVSTVAQTSTSAEILRGLGYWYFYGRDGLSQWTDAANLYTQNPVLLVVSFVVPAFGLAAAVLTRWRHRVYFVALVGVGLLLGVGTHPYGNPAPAGAVLKAATEKSAAGLALRNSPRAVPLLVLGLAGLTAVGVEALRGWCPTLRWRRLRGAADVVVVALAVVAVVNLPPLWNGRLISPDLRFPETLPTAWTDATAALDAAGDATRVLEVPGSDFGAYRWGQTQDPATPGLLDRPWIGRELTAFGTPATADLLRAFDRRIQEGVFDPRSVSPIARLFSAGDVLVRLDTQYERYRGPRPGQLWDAFGAGNEPPPGLGAPRTFGPRQPDRTDPRQPTRDELALARPAANPDPPELAAFPVSDTRPVVRAEATSRALVVAGDGEGLVDAAEAGLLPPTGRSVLYAASFAEQRSTLDTLLGRGADVLVTDTNRRRAQRWGTIRENNGATEAAGSTALVHDPKDARLDVFPAAGDDDRTVADYGADVADVRASSYGNIVAYSAEARPANALDGDPRTAWTTGGYSDVVGDHLRVDYKHPVSADHVDLAQLNGNRWITRVTVRADGRPVATVDLDDTSFGDAGQRVDLGGVRTFTSLDVRIDAASVSGLENYLGYSNVGIRELRVPGVSSEERIRLPVDLAAAAGDPSRTVTFLLSRWRADPVEGFRQDPELSMTRVLTLGAARSFVVSGEARIAGRTEGASVDQLLGRPGLGTGAVVVHGDDYLHGALDTRPSSALDGDPTTAWSLGFGEQTGRGFTVESPTPITLTTLRLAVVADGWHSVPASLALTLDDGRRVEVPVPAIADGTTRGQVATVDVPMPAGLDGATTRTLDVRITAVRPVTTREYFSGDPHDMPVAVAELGLPGVRVGAPAPDVTDTCRDDLVSVDGTALPVRLRGTSASAAARQPLRVEPCSGAPLTLGPGEHVVRTAKGRDVSVDVDRLVLASPGTAAPLPAGSAPGASTTAAPATTAPAALPRLTVRSTGRLSYRVEVDGATEPFWLVLGQSRSDGWTAKVGGGGSLGTATLVDGFASGWLVDPAKTGTSFTVSIEWTPQRLVWLAVTVSALWFAGVLALVAATWWRHRRDDEELADATPGLRAARPLVVTGLAGRRPLLASVGPVRAVAAVAVVGVGAALAGGLVVGLLAALGCLLALVVPRGRTVLASAPILLVGLIVADYVARQVLRSYPPGVEWPAAFTPAHQLGLLAVAFVGADTIVRIVSRSIGATGGPARRADGADPANDGGQSDGEPPSSPASQRA